MKSHFKQKFYFLKAKDFFGFRGYKSFNPTEEDGKLKFRCGETYFLAIPAFKRFLPMSFIVGQDGLRPNGKLAAKLLLFKERDTDGFFKRLFSKIMRRNTQ